MLNEELFDPKDLEIAKLKQTIKKFKKYDKKRKKAPTQVPKVLWKGGLGGEPLFQQRFPTNTEL